MTSDTAPAPSRRGLVVGGVAVLVLGAVAYGATRPPPEPDAPRAAPSGSPVTTSTSGPATPTAAATSPVPEEVPTVWSLPPLGERTGLLVAAADARTFAVLDVDRGRVTRVNLPVYGEAQPVAAIEGGWLAFSREPCGDYPCARAPLYAVRGGRATLLGRVGNAMLDTDRRSVWVTSLVSETGDPQHTLMWLERRTFAGERVGPRTRLKPGQDIIGVTPEGPVVGFPFDAEQPVEVVARDTRKARVVVPAGRAVSVAGRFVAWASKGCGGVFSRDCRISVTDTARRRTVHLMTSDAALMRAALSPDGRHLAVVLETGPRPGPGEGAVVFDTTNGATHSLGLTYPPMPDALVWSPDGRWLLAAHQVSDDDGGTQGYRLALWRPGLESAWAALPMDSDAGPVFAVGAA